MRTWSILVLLRGRPRTLRELAERFEVTERTIRRDFEALTALQFPITCSRDADDVDERTGGPTRWALAAVPEWPRREHTPLAHWERREGKAVSTAIKRRYWGT
jgi:hypothetical protein